MALDFNTNRAQITAALLKVNAGSPENNFVLFSTLGNVVAVAKQGIGRAAMIQPLLLPSNQVIFGCLAVTAIKESVNLITRRMHKVNVQWVGPSVPALRKSKVMMDWYQFESESVGAVAKVAGTELADLSLNMFRDEFITQMGGLAYLKTRATHLRFGPDEICTL